MKNSLKTLLCTTAALLVASPAFATSDPNNNWYAGLSGGVSWMDGSDMGGGGQVAVGYKFNDVRLEGEVGYHAADGNGGSSATHYLSYMGNVYYDFNSAFGPRDSGWHVAPYIGAGIGDAAVHYGNNGGVGTTFRHHENHFAYQGMAGLTFVSASMPNTDWNIGYRYTGTDSNNINSNNAEVGVRFHF